MTTPSTGCSQLGNRLSESDPILMGILNVTPDSFSDGGAFLNPGKAVAHAIKMVQEGADVIDMGAESARPGAQPVPPKQQSARLIPVLTEFRRQDPKTIVSVDTTSSQVAQEALNLGADWINDTSALRDDPEMACVAAESASMIVLMHRRGTPDSMQNHGGPRYDDVVQEICTFFRERIDFATAAGIEHSRIILDPGIGFGKRVEHNLLILRRLKTFLRLGYPVLVGTSRKSFLGAILGIEDPVQRDLASVVTSVMVVMTAEQDCFDKQADKQTPLGPVILRVHDIAKHRQSIQLCRAIQSVT